MAHEVETMMYAKEVPWHSLGTYVGEEPVTSEIAFIKAGVNWTVEKRPCYNIFDELDTATMEIRQRIVPVDNHNIIVRTSDNRALGVVSDDYTIVQNSEAFAFVDSLAGPNGVIRYHTAGALRGGQRIWLLAEIMGLDIGPDASDQTKPYICFFNSHDGKGSIRAFLTSVRVVCNNTLTLALQTDAADGISIRHRGNLTDRLQEAQRILGLARGQYEKYSEQTKWLSNTPMSDSEYRMFIRELFDYNESTQAQKLYAHLEGKFYSSDESICGTRWAALNAVTEYTSHEARTRRVDGANLSELRFMSNINGTSAKVANRALNLLIGV